MSTLADDIERYIKTMLDRAESEFIEIQRYRLARIFDCVPSQISYVLKTRFTEERGYVVESRRGGGGCIRILRVTMYERPSDVRQLLEGIGRYLSAEQAEAIIARLHDEEVLTEKQAFLLSSILRRETQDVGLHLAGIIRASLLRSMLLLLIEETEQDRRAR